MATVNYVWTKDLYGGANHVLWETLTVANADGQPIELPGATDRSVQVLGTFDTNTVTIQGSNVAVPGANDWSTLHDVNGDALTFTTSGIQMISEICRWVRPITASGTTVDVDVHLFARKP